MLDLKIFRRQLIVCILIYYNNLSPNAYPRVTYAKNRKSTVFFIRGSFEIQKFLPHSNE